MDVLINTDNWVLHEVTQLNRLHNGVFTETKSNQKCETHKIYIDNFCNEVAVHIIKEDRKIFYLCNCCYQAYLSIENNEGKL